MAIVEVKVPQLSESVAEATLLTWKKKPGEAVAIDEILIEVETDKVVLEVPAPSAGVLAELVVRRRRYGHVRSVIARSTAKARPAPPLRPPPRRLRPPLLPRQPPLPPRRTARPRRDARRRQDHGRQQPARRLRRRYGQGWPRDQGRRPGRDRRGRERSRSPRPWPPRPLPPPSRCRPWPRRPPPTWATARNSACR
ncbi:biotin-requiring enzyme domain-containing protein [Ditylenchus destructor]|nr:biotin-requiring enzyme domain-containing protein [Ditylenchus destructor]